MDGWVGGWVVVTKGGLRWVGGGDRCVLMSQV